MTPLEQIIDRSVQATLANRLDLEAERAASEMAREILADPKFRAVMRTIIDRAFAQTMKTLNQPQHNGKRGARRRR